MMRRKIYYIALVFLLAAAAFFMVWAAREESAIMDELAHIPAGYSYMKFLDYRLNPEHPPLLKAFSALPLLSQNLLFPIEHPSWKNEVNSQWSAGAEFLYHSGNDADNIIFLARIFPILLTLGTVMLVYMWAKERMGAVWGLVPAFLFGFSPAVLAHGHYVTTDIAAAFGAIFATYFFVKFLRRPSRKNIILAGIAFGTAQLLKFSLVLLVPYVIFLTIAFWIVEAVRKNAKSRRVVFSAWHYACSLTLFFLIGVVLIYVVYFVFTFNEPAERQAADASTILESYPSQFVKNAVIEMNKSVFLRPLGKYALGVAMVLQRTSYGNVNYFWGEVSNSGSWYYFPAVFLLKEPLPSLMLIFLAVFLGLKNVFRIAAPEVKSQKSKVKSFFSYLESSFPEFAMLVFIAFYWGVSIKSPLNIGIRHILPTLPFLYLLAASEIKTSMQESRTSLGSLWRFNLHKPHKLKYIFLCIAFVWYFAETVFAAPFFLSYFNQFGGGVSGGYRYVTDSNYDWGQDLKRLARFADEHGIEKIAVDYFGGGSPEYYLGNAAVPWSSTKGMPTDAGITWLAISVNTLQNAMQKKAADFPRDPANEYRWLADLKPIEPGLGRLPRPDFRAGTSIFIYNLQL